MPCPCNLPHEIYPEASEWGPLLWTLLHGLAEKSGRPTSPMFLEDERRAWLHFFKETSDIIPCHICKEHFRLYLKEHPIDELKHLQIESMHEWIRSWFWEVHEWVNSTLKKPPFPKDGLNAAYGGSLPLRTIIHRLDAPMRLAIILSGNQYKKFKEWKSRYLIILSILGL